MEINWCGENLMLLPERAVYWPERRALLVADMHVGKDAAFRASGIALPPGIGDSDLERLSDLIRDWTPRVLVILGDLIHARSGMTEGTSASFVAWRELHPALAILLVRGNHDRRAGDPPSEWRIECVSEPFEMAPFLLCHYPPAADSDHPALAGHLHPAVTLVGPASSSMTLPCFWLRQGCFVLPAFTAFAGRPRIVPSAGDRVFVVGEGHVTEVPCTR